MSASCPTLICPADGSDEALLYSVQKAGSGGAISSDCPVINCGDIQLADQRGGDYDKYSLQSQFYPVVIPLDWSIPLGPGEIHFVCPSCGGNPEIDLARSLESGSTFEIVSNLLSEMLQECAARNPCFPSPREPALGPRQLFANQNASCTYLSPYGISYTFAVRRGTFFALSQAEADAAAATWACAQARLLSTSPAMTFSQTDFGWGYGL